MPNEIVAKKKRIYCALANLTFFSDEELKCRHRAHFVWCNSCDEILLDSTLIMYYPAASDPVGWYQNLLNNVSDPVKMYESLTGNWCETPGSFRVWCIMFHSPKNCTEKDPWIRAKCKHRQSSFIKRSNTEREHRCIPIDFIFFRHGTQTFFRVPTRNLAFFFRFLALNLDFPLNPQKFQFRKCINWVISGCIRIVFYLWKNREKSELCWKPYVSLKLKSYHPSSC